MQCPDGKERKCFPLLAAHVVDHKEALKATITKKTHCTSCEAHEHQLHVPDASFQRKCTEVMQDIYRTRAGTLVNEHDIVLDGKGTAVQMLEAKDFMGCR